MFIAERQGFEPRVPRSTTVFKTAAIDHSATSPKLILRVALFFKGGAKVRKEFCFPNFWKKKSIRILYFFFSGPFWQCLKPFSSSRWKRISAFCNR